MKRRTFLGATAGSAAALSGLAGCESKSPKSAAPAPSPTVTDVNGMLAGKTLQELRERYRYDMVDDFIPFLDEFVIDHEYGGFLSNTDRDGTRIGTGKGATGTGRGIWVYSFLYNKLDQNPKYLEVARKAVEFILKNEPKGDDLWVNSFTREGKPLGGPSTAIYEDLFIANGLSEYSKAVKDDSYWEKAKQILLKCMKVYDSPDYAYEVYYGPENASPINAPRVLGHWMVLIRLVTQMLENKSDPEVEAIADRCVDAVACKNVLSEDPVGVIGCRSAGA